MWMPLPDTEREKRMSTLAMAPRGDVAVQGVSQPVRKTRNGLDMGGHRSRPDGLYSSLVRDDCAASPDDQASCTVDVASRRVEDTFAEGSSKALLCTKQDEAGSGTPERRCGRYFQRQQAQCLADGARNHVTICVDASEQRSTLLRSGGRNSTHGRDDRLELPDVLDLRDDIGKPLGHHLVLGPDAVGDGASCDASAENSS